MRLFAVVGNPILHSRSPLLFRAAYPCGGGEMCYVRMRADTAPEALRTFAELGMSGMNVTAPFKTEMAALASVRSATASALNACNTIIKEDNGTLSAHNTDPQGAAGALQGAGAAVGGKQCLVLGAGGAGIAAAYALRQAGGRVAIANRTIAKAQAAAAQTGCLHCGLDAIAEQTAHADIIVNTIPADIIPPECLAPRHTILDAIYPNPALQTKAAAAGSAYIDGGQWLVHQAIPAFRLLARTAPNIKAMQTLAPAAPPRHVSLIGFMGAGKSAAAPLAAQMLGMDCIDTDHIIEQRCADSIAGIIARRGEAFFRQIEKETLCQALQSSRPALIACGGGAAADAAAGAMLHSQSIVVWLYAPPERCLARIADPSLRPLLMQGNSPEQTARTLFYRRLPSYAQAAWILVNVENKTSRQASEIIYDEVNRTLSH